MPVTLSLYIVKRFFFAIVSVWFAVLLVGSMFDMVELVRRAAARPEVSFGMIAEMWFLHLPAMADKMMPFGVLIGSMVALLQLTRSHELVVARASGVSVWQFLVLPLLLAFFMGVMSITVFNTLEASTRLKFEYLEAKYFKGQASLMTITSSGLWIRQIEQDDPAVSEYIIHAVRVVQHDMTLLDVSVFALGHDDDFIERIDAREAELENGEWHFIDAVRSKPGMPAENLADYRIKTDKTIAEIQDSFASPKTIPLWQLPSFIHTLEQAGFSAIRHRLYWHSLLSTPFLLAAMVLVAAVFSLRLPRRGQIGLLIVAGLLTGFVLRFLKDLTTAFGEAGSLPVPVASWAPVAIFIVISTALLLHLEDG